MSDFVCANGHEFPELSPVKCSQCDAQVACMPTAKFYAMQRTVIGLAELLDKEELIARKNGRDLAAERLAELRRQLVLAAL